MLLKNNFKRSLIHILSYLESGEVLNPMVKRLKVYQGKPGFCGKERVKLVTDDFLVEHISIFHRGKSVLKEIVYSKIMSFYDIEVETQKSFKKIRKR